MPVRNDVGRQHFCFLKVSFHEQNNSCEDEQTEEHLSEIQKNCNLDNSIHLCFAGFSMELDQIFYVPYSTLEVIN